MSTTKIILAVIVLYKVRPEESASYVALSRHLSRDPAMRERLDLVVIDNSPEAQPLPLDSPGTYCHDGENPGLAKRYNYARKVAARAGATWLLLLDQDTCLTREYLDEVLTLSQHLTLDKTIVAIVPKLVAGSQVYSPHGPQYRGPMPIPQLDTYGVFQGLIRPFNSGALLRLQSIDKIGGFPEEYWLDYLDHATFHAMQRGGGEIFIMHARLEHELSFHRPEKRADPANAARHRNQLAAMVRFYHQHGSSSERLRLRADLILQALRSFVRGHAPEGARYLHAAVSRPVDPRP